ncbi:Flp pilus assembly pilin Flp [Curtobacterium flaccumfaciens]|uniref:Flp pilus assembly pilin Flp n=1 Tax=Curtobacterium salicis TaxID=1779862 RepID=A0ABX0T9B4_9MICO|nr:TadE/TadG family type IV pilus assembly protein [Curtobacterium sp. WW7]NII42086.1 Flp pilus assembly pilin Flp [Curtobacterium sp. WW7]
MSNRSRQGPSERGSVTVEFAVALPIVAVVLAAGIAGVVAVDLQGRLQTATAVAARAVARGDDAAARRVLGQAGAGPIRVERASGLVCVEVGRPAGGGPFANVVLRGSSCAVDELDVHVPS